MNWKALLFSRRKKYSKKRRILVTTAIVLAAVLLCTFLISADNGKIRVTRKTVSVPGLSTALEGYTVVLLSDLHGKEFGKKQETLVQSIVSADPDVVCIAGDVTGKNGDPRAVLDLAEGLNGKCPVFLVAGDSDPMPVNDTPDENGNFYAPYIQSLAAAGVTYLDTPAYLPVGSSKVWFTSSLHMNINAAESVAQAETAFAAVNADENATDAEKLSAQYALAKANALSAAARGVGEADLSICLSHVPMTEEFIRAVEYSSVSQKGTFMPPMDIVLSGHLVGGQWRLPFFGAVKVCDPRLDGNFTQSEVSGLTRVGSISRYVTVGLGTSDSYRLPAFRLFNTPEIVVLKFTGQLGIE